VSQAVMGIMMMPIKRKLSGFLEWKKKVKDGWG